jgi:hypothetical protein
MARVLLSYATADLQQVRKLREDLEAAGHSAWIAADEVLVGESIPSAVARGLKAADYVVPCLSRTAVTSGWVKAELELAVMRQLSTDTARVLPVRFEDVPPPDVIANLRYVDLFPDALAYQRGVERLLASIQAHEVSALP